jgi:hypothetical protein
MKVIWAMNRHLEKVVMGSMMEHREEEKYRMLIDDKAKRSQSFGFY